MQDFKIARVFGIDIKIHWSWLFAFLLIIWGLTTYFAQFLPGLSFALRLTAAILTTVFFFVSLLLHELAHSLTAKCFGIKTKEITLFLFGGMAQMEGDSLAGSPGSELVVSAAGPLCSLLLAACFLGTLLFRPPDYLLYSFYYLSVINLIFAVFNLIPLFPMDGGRILRAILSWKTKNPLRATKIVCVLTKTMAPALVIGVYFWAGIINAVWIGVITWLFLLPAAEGEYQTILIKEKLSRVLVRDLMEQPPGVVLPFTCTERTREESTPHFCSPDETVLASIKKMKQLNAWHLWVREDDLIIGIIFAEKIAKCLNE